MKLAIGVVCVLSLFGERGARADCDPAPPKAATIEVLECTSVDHMGSDTSLERNAEQGGVLVTGNVEWSDGKGEDLRLWLPSSEKVDCKNLPEATQLTAKVEKVCCGEQSSTPCNAGATAVISHAKVRPANWLKKASRAQLENEVQRMRAENARLRADLFQMRARIEAENERLRQETKKLDRRLK